MQQTLIEMYTDILNLLAEFDARSSRKEGKFINTLPQVSAKVASLDLSCTGDCKVQNKKGLCAHIHFKWTHDDLHRLLCTHNCLLWLLQECCNHESWCIWKREEACVLVLGEKNRAFAIMIKCPSALLVLILLSMFDMTYLPHPITKYWILTSTSVKFTQKVSCAYFMAQSVNGAFSWIRVHLNLNNRDSLWFLISSQIRLLPISKEIRELVLKVSAKVQCIHYQYVVLPVQCFCLPGALSCTCCTYGLGKLLSSLIHLWSQYSTCCSQIQQTLHDCVVALTSTVVCEL